MKVANEMVQSVVAAQEESYKSGAVQYIDSREVAEVVEKEHKNLIRDIKRYNKELGELNFEPSDFFIESTYKNSQNKTMPCYLITRKGCEFIAHKLTGEKGTKFTATYINRFHEMQNQLAGETQVSAEQFNQLYESVIILAEEVQKLKGLVADKSNGDDIVHNKVNKNINNPYSFGEIAVIEERKKELYRLTAKVAELYNVPHTGILHQMYKVLEERLDIVLDSYKSVYRSDTGKENAGMVEVIAANDWIYENAVELNEYVISKKQVYG